MTLIYILNYVDMKNVCVDKFGDLPHEVAITIAPVAFALGREQLQDFYTDMSYFMSILTATNAKLQMSDDFVVRAYVNSFHSASRLFVNAYEAAVKDPRGFTQCVNIHLEQLLQSDVVHEVAFRLRNKLLEARKPIP